MQFTYLGGYGWWARDACLQTVPTGKRMKFNRLHKKLHFSLTRVITLRFVTYSQYRLRST